MNALEMQEVSKTFRTPSGLRHALDGFSFQTEPGTATAWIGPNGAGKSTALRVAAGILAPTEGRVLRRRRCTSLIELSGAFHSDLPGEENLRAGLVLAGFGRSEVRRRFPAVAEFSDLGPALRQPLKHYSDGMVARLACAIAAHSDPDLLLLDEVLAVGDRSFQRRMLSHVAGLVAEGTALIIVTHSPDLAAAASTRAVLIEAGRSADDGPTSDVLERYEASSGARARASTRTDVKVEEVVLHPRRIRPGDSLDVEATLAIAAPIDGLGVRLELRPVAGTTEPWMRDPEEPMDRRHLNLLAATPTFRPGPSAGGRLRVHFEVPRVPVTQTALVLSVVAFDASDAVMDVHDVDLLIGDSVERPSYLLEVHARC